MTKEILIATYKSVEKFYTEEIEKGEDSLGVLEEVRNIYRLVMSDIDKIKTDYNEPEWNYIDWDGNPAKSLPERDEVYWVTRKVGDKLTVVQSFYLSHRSRFSLDDVIAWMPIFKPSPAQLKT